MTETTYNLGRGIDPAVDEARPEINRRLRAVERDRGLRVVFACESGSRAWGFASTDSDFDVRFIYTMPIESYLQLRPLKDAFDLHTDGDYDLAGWDIRKTAELLRKSNPPLLEWLDSPILYEADDRITPRLVALRGTFFDPKKTAYHYLSLAAGIWKKYLADDPTPKRKKYLYILRPLACIRYIELHQSQPPTLFDAVLEAIDWPAEAMDAVGRLVTAKRAAEELGQMPADRVFSRYIPQWLDEAEAIAEALPTNDTPTTELDALIWDALLPNRT
jgi:hypothetical protein